MPTIRRELARRLTVACLLLVFAAASSDARLARGTFDTVILGGRVMDPESGLDAVRNVGISNGKVVAISTRPLRGRTTVDARGLVVAPGFIDLHVHDMTAEHHRAQAMDGVTTALELEVGTADVDRWYGERAGKTLVNYGVSVGHIPARMTVMGDAGTFVPVPTGDAARRAASKEELGAIARVIEKGLERGAVAVGFGINYTPAATRAEVLDMFRVASRFHASCHVHLRYGGIREPGSGVAALEEVIAAAAVTGAPLHVVHVTSVGLADAPLMLEMIGEARARGMDVTTECYPYEAGMTDIKSAIFDAGWQENMGIDFGALQWAATGERLTAESFERYRKQGGMVAVFSIPESVVRSAVAHPLTTIASDGLLANGKGHPRAAGTYARVLGRFVRETKALSLMDALRKMTLMPARRLERRVPAMKDKGRVRIGADADITLFDPERVVDRATFEKPGAYSEGIRHVLVNGVLVVRDGVLVEEVAPGRPVRAPFR
jgi:N-acyl-D-aspartate/D-glutamate deacylase